MGDGVREGGLRQLGLRQLGLRQLGLRQLGSVLGMRGGMPMESPIDGGIGSEVPRLWRRAGSGAAPSLCVCAPVPVPVPVRVLRESAGASGRIVLARG